MAFWSAARSPAFVVEQNNVTTLDVDLSPSFKAASFGSGFANYFTNGRYVFNGNDGNDTFKSGHGADRLIGGDGNDNLDGNIGNDRVIGGDGDDILNGGRGNDTVIGGLGTDSLSGGKNADKFEFNDITESVVGAGRDVIINFHHSQHDRIVLSGIDADTMSRRGPGLRLYQRRRLSLRRRRASLLRRRARKATSTATALRISRSQLTDVTALGQQRFHPVDDQRMALVFEAPCINSLHTPARGHGQTSSVCLI